MELKKHGEIAWQVRKQVCQALGVSPTHSYRRDSLVEELVGRMVEVVIKYLGETETTVKTALETKEIQPQPEATPTPTKRKRGRPKKELVISK